LLRFGTFLPYTPLHPFNAEAPDLYADMVELAVLADELGFDTVWVPEHHGLYTLQAPGPLLLAVQLAEKIKCRIGTAVAVLPYRHPLVWAGEVAAADIMTGGRLDFGVARGAYQYEFDRLGLDFADSKELFEESLEVIIGLLADDKLLAHEGKHFPMPPTKIWPRALQTPHPPVWVGAQSEPTIRWSVARGHNVFNSPFYKPLSHTVEMADVFHEAREAAGFARGELKFGSLRQAFVSESETDIQRALEVAQVRQRTVGHLHTYDQDVDENGFIATHPIEGEPTFEMARANQLFGTPDEVLAKVVAFDEAGVDHLIPNFLFGLDTEAVAHTMRLFAETVIRPYREGRAIEAAVAGPAVALTGDNGKLPFGY
jgi:alkanesulfonate monooxygenase SsuD/methylene tetrahydromethanopterin reductase-like flavin-dependent oxidoreductase (luciferase family)